MAQAVQSWITRRRECQTAWYRFEILDAKHRGKTFVAGFIVTHPGV